MMVMHGYLTTAGRFVMTSGEVLPWARFVTHTESPDDRNPAPEEDEQIIPVSETVTETMPDAEPDPEGLDDEEDE